MQPELLFRAVSYALMELLGITLFCVFMISARKEIGRGEPVRGVLWFGLAVVCICAIIALLAGFPTAMTLEKISNHPVRDHAGKIVRIAGVAADITESVKTVHNFKKPLVSER